MSMEAVWEFRAKAEADAVIGGEIRVALAKNGDLAAVAAVARRHGFDVTDAEIEQGWAEASKGELTAFELELVSAGFPNLMGPKGQMVDVGPWVGPR